MLAEELFSPDYFQARRRFLGAAHELGLDIETSAHPSITDPRGEIATDVVRLGPRDARYVLFVLSGVHGTELTAGSGLQLALLEKYADNLPADTAMVLVHAVNAVGSSRCRRTDEGNVDPNRNVRDFSEPLPVNDDYATLHDAICPENWTGEGRKEAEVRIADYVARNAFGSLTRNVLRGQYQFPDGLFYGGREEIWCVQNTRAVINSHAAHVDRVAVLDLHTGLGPKGYGDPMRLHEPPPGGVEWERIGGYVVNLIDDVCPPPRGLKVLLEFGTEDFETVLEAQRADNWLMRQGDPDTEQGRQIKEQIRKALFVDDPAWCQKIHDQALEITSGLLEELVAS